MTAIAYMDCPSGASGDMIMGAFLDLGLPLETLRERLALLGLRGYSLEAPIVKKQGLAARSFQVLVEKQDHHRHWSDIRRMIEESGLADGEKRLSLAVFERLARAEARMHGVEPDRVHFHEVGAVDSIVDIVGAAAAWEYFSLTSLVVSPLPLGQGFIDTAHGRLPLPAPATLALLDGVPTYGSGLGFELVTPTGAALLTTLADSFGPRPAMTVKATGHGAGMRDLPDRPNILRLTLGETEAAQGRERLIVSETNLDDMNPEVLPFVMERLFKAGALDVWLTPVQMKKGRPGVVLSYLSRVEEVDRLSEVVFSETGTLGLRSHAVDRRSLSRSFRTLDTPFGPVQVKVVQRGDGEELIPEHEECRRIATETGLPLRKIYEKIQKIV